MRLEYSENIKDLRELEGVLSKDSAKQSGSGRQGLLDEFSHILDKISLQLAGNNEFADWTKIEKIQAVKEIVSQHVEQPKREKAAKPEKAAEREVKLIEDRPETKEAQEKEDVQGEQVEEEVQKASDDESEPEITEEVQPEQEQAELEAVPENEVSAEQAVSVESAAHTALKGQPVQQATSQPTEQSSEPVAEDQRLQWSELQAKTRSKVEIQAKDASEIALQTQTPEQKFEFVEKGPRLEVPMSEVAKGASKGTEKKAETVELLDSIMKSLLDVQAQELPTLQNQQTSGKESLIASLLTRQLLGKAAAKLMDTSMSASQSASNTSISDTSAANGTDGSDKTRSQTPRALTKPQEARTMKQVEQVLKEAAKSKDGKTISLRLDPPSLGSLKVDVSLRDAALHARISAESAQVATLLREKAAELQSMLRELGLSVDNVTVSVRGDGQSSFEQEVHQQGNDASDQSGDGSLNGEAGQGEGDAVVGSDVENNVEDHWVA